MRGGEGNSGAPSGLVPQPTVAEAVGPSGGSVTAGPTDRFRGVGARSVRLVRRILGWLMDSGRLPEYSLARRLELETVDREG